MRSARIPHPFDGALSKVLVMPETANSRLDYGIWMYQPMVHVAHHKHI
jgi:hypothetical protein